MKGEIPNQNSTNKRPCALLNLSFIVVETTQQRDSLFFRRVLNNTSFMVTSLVVSASRRSGLESVFALNV